MTAEDLFIRFLTFLFAVLLFASSSIAALWAWAFLVDQALELNFDSFDEVRSMLVWLALIAALLWASVGALVGRWWVTLFPVAVYVWVRCPDLIRNDRFEFSDWIEFSYEAWLVIAVCSLGIGCGLRVWASQRGV